MRIIFFLSSLLLRAIYLMAAAFLMKHHAPAIAAICPIILCFVGVPGRATFE